MARARRGLQPSIASSKTRSATALLLVEAGAKLNRIDEDGKSALDHADENGLAAVSTAIRARGGRPAAEIEAIAAAEIKAFAAAIRARGGSTGAELA